MKKESILFVTKERESAPIDAPTENIFKKLFKAILAKKILKSFDNYKTYNTPEFL